jgi:hypothetical protein
MGSCDLLKALQRHSDARAARLEAESDWEAPSTSALTSASDDIESASGTADGKIVAFPKALVDFIHASGSKIPFRALAASLMVTRSGHPIDPPLEEVNPWEILEEAAAAGARPELSSAQIAILQERAASRTVV